MGNEAMRRKFEAGEVLDVEVLTIPKGEPDTDDPELMNTYRLREFVDDIDYCVRSRERWIWSIGRRKADGAIFAALDTRFYQNPAFECLWLR